jgi:hypothetical protein
MASTAKRDLQRDLESYACGEVPSALELLRCPVLERWSTEVRSRGKEYVLLIHAEALRHPEYGDGEPITTGAVFWFDRKDRFIRTAQRAFVLGKPA